MLHSFASDCHCHSSCSPDGRHPAEAMLARAKELGLYAVTLTDHCECNEYEKKYRERALRACGFTGGLSWASLCRTCPGPRRR